MKRAFALLLCGSLASCADATPSVFIAMNRDFDGFTRWRQVDLGTIALAGHPPGSRVAFVNATLAADAREYPVGSIIVKAITGNSPDPSAWAVIAMVKRGGGFNRDGARDWEFFTLRVTGQSVSIVERGLAPRSDDDGDPYGVTAGVGCNTCHGTEDARMVDSILTPQLRPPGVSL